MMPHKNLFIGSTVLLSGAITLALVLDHSNSSTFVYLALAAILAIVAVSSSRLSIMRVGSPAVSNLLGWVASSSKTQNGMMVIAWLLWIIGISNSAWIAQLSDAAGYPVGLALALAYWGCLIALVLITRTKRSAATSTESSHLSGFEVFLAFSAAALFILISLFVLLQKHLRSGGERFEYTRPPQLALLFVALLSALLFLAVRLTEGARVGNAHGDRTSVGWALVLVLGTGLIEYFGAKDWYRFALSSFSILSLFLASGRLFHSARPEGGWPR